jgi:alkylation response protein AidB-like acyl-CoA dehydrogenase
VTELTDTRAEEPQALNPQAIAKSLKPLLREHATVAEKQGKISDEVFKALQSSGLFSMMFPKRAGGVGRKLITHLETVAELAKADPASAWAFGLLSSVSASAAALPKNISDTIFNTGKELVCSVAARTGTAKPCADGYEISGSWPYASGCMHADWAMNGVNILDEQGNIVDAGFAIMPLRANEQVKIKNTWQVAGVSASGSNTVTADQLILPPHLLLSFKNLRSGASDDPAVIAALEPRDRWPVEPLFPLTVLAPMLGAAEGILELVKDSMPKRKIIGWQYESQAGSDILLGVLAEASLEIESAWLHIRRTAALVDEVSPQRTLSGFEKAKMQADCGYAMKLARSAADKLMDIAGPGSFALNNAMQRLWRDLNVGSRHNALNSRLSMALYGRAILGIESNLELLADIGPKPSAENT